jgi:hypothetical protein
VSGWLLFMPVSQRRIRRTNHALRCTTNVLSVHSQCTARLLGLFLIEPVQLWTGRAACALQAALRMTNESFAAHPGTRGADGRNVAPEARAHPRSGAECSSVTVVLQSGSRLARSPRGT